jgi:predicted RNA-binding Zn ribbon-like protein
MVVTNAMQTPAPAAPHVHAAGIDACLDLVNTVELSDGRPQDHLQLADDGVAVLAGLGLGHDEALRHQALREGDAWLLRVREARAAMRELWDAQVEGRAPAPAALATLNDLLERGPRVVLRGTLAGVEVGHRHDDEDPTGEALARAALPLVDAIATGATARFRICANDGCRWVFEDASRAGRRRWCDMATCGNRAKARRYRSRRRDEPDGAAGPTRDRSSAG